MSLIATLVGFRGSAFTYELADATVPPMYILRAGKLYAVQPWELPPGSAAIHATYRRIKCLDVSAMDCTVQQPEEEKAA
jgi:hypothetical protein